MSMPSAGRSDKFRCALTFLLLSVKEMAMNGIFYIEQVCPEGRVGLDDRERPNEDY